MQISRRNLLVAAGAAPIALAVERPKIAAIVTEYRKYSHGQHIVDRFLEGYGWNGEHHHPPMDLVSLYVDQQPKGAIVQLLGPFGNLPHQRSHNQNLS